MNGPISRIVVIVETDAGRPDPVTFELAAWAERLEEMTGAETVVLVIGQSAPEAGEEIAGRVGRSVVAVRVPNDDYNQEVHLGVLSRLLPEIGAAWILAAHSATGADFAPGLAVRLGAAAVSGVEDLAEQDGRPVFRRAAFGGKIMIDVAAVEYPVVATFLPGLIRPKNASGAGGLEIRDIDEAPQSIRNLGRKTADAVDSALDLADVVVAAGRGIGKKENLDLIRRLAARFPKSAVAGSRPICDLKWLGYQSQVGQTGRSVSPKLYIACGISGARQHTAGMRGAGFIVAVNTDPDAPICNLADVCVIEDLTVFIPAFENACNKRES